MNLSRSTPTRKKRCAWCLIVRKMMLTLQHLFQLVVKTVEGVRSDAIFSYLPPVNLLAFLVLSPLSWILSPRALHRLNVFAIRATVSANMLRTNVADTQSFPFLMAISAYERYQHRSRRRIHLRGETTSTPSLFEYVLLFHIIAILSIVTNA
jgi:hypothetical protein